MSQRYRLAPAARVSKTLSETLYGAAEALQKPEALAPGDRARLIESLITQSAAAHSAKPPSAVLSTLVWVVEMAQDRATLADFNTAQEALDEHDALAFVADWLEAEGQDVTPIRNAAPAAETLAELVARRDAEQAALDALEAADLAPEPGEVITDALRPYLGAALAENHADDVLGALDAAGFTIARKAEPDADDAAALVADLIARRDAGQPLGEALAALEEWQTNRAGQAAANPAKEA